VPLSYGAGEVAAVGDWVTRVKVGDRIAGLYHPRWFGGPIRPEYLTDRLRGMSTACWRNTRSLTKKRSCLCQATSPSRKPRHCHLLR
jgi:hypothetical protein